MVKLKLARLALAVMALLCLCSSAWAHAQMSSDERAQHHSNTKRDSEALSQCLQSPEMHEHNIHTTAHRDDTLYRLRKAHTLRRDLEQRNRESANKWAAVKHGESPGHSQDPQDIFNFRWNEDPTYNNTGCALAGLSTYGPYWHEGQPRRADIRAGQDGVYLRLAIQIIDVSTCKPLSGAQVDTWQATSMGEYSSTMNGYLRGWQPSSKHGTVDFDTIFPGHYSGRASHIHIVVRALDEKRVIQFGMIYFDQDIRDEVERTDKYKNNKQELKDNIGDDFIQYDSSDSYDPYVRWARIGNGLDGGLLGWITIGVNTKDNHVPQPPNSKRSVIDWHLE
ncbi:hypothetical protein HBH98_016870 [Parastagonospora nodorum]|nr:hypothetical protein HBH53_095430 [Parastagonospora nodorum]KAH3972227.1 hypothetical protein HBH52_149820 [Parastagonospora nodorum]KAH3983542.1 hypothetical protein HBH51_032730 [Parastagonospora nodorum]KAH4005740.1 hypothetical protein HBI10_037960 [Parastagonospora nodorum]KAH4032729.1 hypothetical protein HBI13_001200 [Parastagonospora nodorum]